MGSRPGDALSSQVKGKRKFASPSLHFDRLGGISASRRARQGAILFNSVLHCPASFLREQLCSQPLKFQNIGIPDSSRILFGPGFP